MLQKGNFNVTIQPKDWLHLKFCKRVGWHACKLCVSFPHPELYSESYMIITAPSVKGRNMEFYYCKHVIAQTLLCVKNMHWIFKSPLSHLTHRDEKCNAARKIYFWDEVKKGGKNEKEMKQLAIFLWPDGF